MKYCRLQKNKTISLSKVGLGCVTFGREIDESTSFKLLDHAFENGINWFDTAEGYGGGNAQLYRKNFLNVNDIREKTNLMSSSEIILGKWIKSRKCINNINICTKVSTGNSPDNIKRAIQASLERLKVNKVDIYKLHSPDNSVPLSESISALNDLVSSNLTKVIGCSNFKYSQLKESLEICKKFKYDRFEIIQNPFNLVAAEDKNTILPFCKNNKIFVTSYSPLAAGFLTGKYTQDKPFPKGSRFDIIPGHADIYFKEKNFQIAANLKNLSKKYKIPLNKLALSWVFNKNLIDSVIIGARKISHIDNALSSMEFELDQQINQEIENIIS